MKTRVSIYFVVLMTLSLCVLSAAAQDTPQTIKGGIVNGKALSLPKPEYSDEARAAGLEGTVFVDVVIDETGAVVSAVAATEPRKMYRTARGADHSDVSPAHQILRDAAEKAALEAKFSPTLLSGVPVKVAGTVVYRFVARSEPSAVNGGLLNGKATSLPAPEYPAAALAVRAAGTVAIQITISEEGNVISATAMSGHPLLRAAAVEAARSATFAPPRLNGQPVKVSGVLTYNFVLPKDDTN